MWVYCPVRKRGLSPKLGTHWKGPGTITERLSDVVYRVRVPGRRRPVVLHRDRLAPYQPSAPAVPAAEQEGATAPHPEDPVPLPILPDVAAPTVPPHDQGGAPEDNPADPARWDTPSDLTPVLSPLPVPAIPRLGRARRPPPHLLDYDL